MSMDESAWEAVSRGAAVRRAGRAGFLRNVGVALGNWGSSAATPVLASALSDPDPLVRGHSAWVDWSWLDALHGTGPLDEDAATAPR
jgi:epoxyqueuosine reductase